MIPQLLSNTREYSLIDSHEYAHHIKTLQYECNKK